MPPPNCCPDPAGGPLDGLTVFRYGHTYDSGGGMESYLEDLNRCLLSRSRATVVQIQLTSRPEHVGEVSQDIGRGRLIRRSLFVSAASHEAAVSGPGRPNPAVHALRTGRDLLLSTRWIAPAVSRRLLAPRQVPPRPGEPEDLLTTLEDLHRRFPPAVLCLHTAGSADASVAIHFARRNSIPVGYVHHFANERLRSPAMIQQLSYLDGVAGVCGVKVPGYLRKQFVPVADGIDTAFFRREPGSSAVPGGEPVLFLPARLTPTKGQAELILLAGALNREGLRVRVALAGRVDNAAYEEQLRRLAAQQAIAERVDFLGPLGPEALRDAYQRAYLVVFPTSHHEGLPRILMEAQAMGVPPVVYNIGGTSDGLRDRETGRLVAAGDFRQLLGSVRALVVRPADRNRLGAAAAVFAHETFSLAALAGRHETFLLGLRAPAAKG